MSPTTPALQQLDLAALSMLFTEFGPAHTADEMHVFAVHHTVAQILALGWIEKCAPAGRWGITLYTAAGDLKAAILGTPSTVQPFPPSTSPAQAA